ncbi:MAG: nicotinate (nicotinamide) nucleotide adenylyltransferase [Clostridia bacterium]|nr:nicotinate (nicotinamide) nucleotide adenylyltransferase [Clostridia bacterium]
MKIGIYGGTFDPPHLGHTNACKAFLEAISLDYLYVIPAFVPPHKIINSGISPEKRFEMAKLAFSKLSSKIIVSDMEYKRQGKSYTAETIKYFKEHYNGVEIYFLCGTDMILTMDMWYHPEYIFANAKIVYVRRENNQEITKKINEKCKLYREKYNADIIYLSLDTKEMSSSEIRSAILEKKELSGYLSPEIIEYINQNALYME